MKQSLLYGFVLMFLFYACNNDDPADSDENIVINELLPKNSTTGSDEDGDFDDWIEIYNPAANKQDISGYYLSDSKKNPTKWKFS